MIGRSIAAPLLLALCAFTPSSLAAQTVSFDDGDSSLTHDMHALPTHVGGRVVVEALPNGGTRFEHEWPGVYFEAAFEGERVLLRFDDAFNEYRLLIDDLAPLLLGQPGASAVTVSGIGGGAHRLRLEKVTESIDLPAAFEGFYVPASAHPLEVAPRPRQIEFIGDSGMAGYGIRSGTRQCTKEEVRLLTDTQAAYPALVARHFGADYQINAVSGRGMVRNYAGESPEIPLPAVYSRAIPSRPGDWHDPSWQPQIIVVGLYANDFSTPLKPGEAWASEAELVAAFSAAYEPFLAELHRRSPNAAVLVVWPVAEQPAEQAAAMVEAVQRQIVDAARTVGIQRILFPALTDLGFDKSACDYHSSLADHRKLEAWLTAYIEARPELWQGR